MSGPGNSGIAPAASAAAIAWGKFRGPRSGNAEGVRPEEATVLPGAGAAPAVATTTPSPSPVPRPVTLQSTSSNAWGIKASSLVRSSTSGSGASTNLQSPRMESAQDNVAVNVPSGEVKDVVASPSNSKKNDEVFDQSGSKRIQNIVISCSASPRKGVFRGDAKGFVGASKKAMAAMNTSERPMRKQESGIILECEYADVYANHFPVSFKNLPKEIFHYDVMISPLDNTGKAYEATLPDKILPLVWRTFERECKDLLGTSTPYDGKKNVYTAKRIDVNGDTYTQDVSMKDPDDPGRIRKFSVSIKLVNILKTKTLVEFLKSVGSGVHVAYPQDVIQGLDVALRYNPSLNYTVVNRSFFSPPKEDIERHMLNRQLVLWSGHYQSLILGCENNAMLNIDLATKAFYKGMPLTDFLRNLFNMTPNGELDVRTWTPNDFATASEALKGKLIAYGTGPKNENGEFEIEHAFPAVGVVRETANSYRFISQDEEISIAQHFERKQTKIEHSEYPCVHIGSANQTNYVPLELCRIIPQAYRGKMDKTLTAKMIKGAAVGPKERFQRIFRSREGCRFEQCSAVRDFGLKVDKTVVTIKGAKKFAGPGIRVNKKGGEFPSVDKKTGGWNYRGRSDRHQFLNPAEVPKFAIMSFENVNVTRFLDTLADLGTGLGMRNFKEAIKSAPPVVSLRADYGGRERESLSVKINKQLQRFKKEGYQLVFVVLGPEGKEYAAVKAEAEVQVGILTACVKRKNVEACQIQTMTNFLLKLNSKLNGVNWNVENMYKHFNGEPTIIFGADVTHPAPNSSAPSIAAVTASYDLSGMCYNMHIQPQKSREEVINGVADIVTSMCKSFQMKTNVMPKRLLMFRDGVSEGYFDEVKLKEYEKIKAACQLLCDPPMKVTFVVVKKRHHTRLMPMDQRLSVGKFNNILPGTVVDKVLVHPTEQEFFLNSHVGIQGTSKPTRYHVIHDDNNFTMSQIERITYHLCYAFVRCTQPVSYPAATYYAHLAAYRARLLIENEGENADIAQLQRQLTIHPDLIKNYPFFYI